MTGTSEQTEARLQHDRECQRGKSSDETLEQQTLGCNTTESTIERATGYTESSSSNENAVKFHAYFTAR